MRLKTSMRLRALPERDRDGTETSGAFLERGWNGRALAERDWVTPRALAVETKGPDASLARRTWSEVQEAHLQNASAVSDYRTRSKDSVTWPGLSSACRICSGVSWARLI